MPFVITKCPLSIARTETPGTARSMSYGGEVKKSAHCCGETSGVSEGTVDARTEDEAVGPGVGVGCSLLVGCAAHAATNKGAAIKSIAVRTMWLFELCARGD